jgi:hypothetical protein
MGVHCSGAVWTVVMDQFMVLLVTLWAGIRAATLESSMSTHQAAEAPLFVHQVIPSGLS